MAEDSRNQETRASGTPQPDNPLRRAPARQRTTASRQPARGGRGPAHARINEPPPPAPQQQPRQGGAQEDDEYQWHTGVKRETGRRSDRVHRRYKAFGRNRILRGLNMGIPEGIISMILGPSGTGKSLWIKHMVGLLYPDEGDLLVHGESVPNLADDELFEMRKNSGCSSRTARCSAR